MFIVVLDVVTAIGVDSRHEQKAKGASPFAFCAAPYRHSCERSSVSTEGNGKLMSGCRDTNEETRR